MLKCGILLFFHHVLLASNTTSENIPTSCRGIFRSCVGSEQNVIEEEQFSKMWYKKNDVSAGSILRAQFKIEK